MQKGKLIIATIIAVAVIVSAWLLAGGIKHFSGGDPKITVTGMASRQIKSDQIVWTIKAVAVNKDQRQAYAEHKRYKERILAYLKERGIEQEQISFSSTSVEEKYDQYYSNQMQKYIREYKGFELMSDIIITSSRVDEVEQIYQSISELLHEGIGLVARAPRYYYTQLNTLKMEMLQEASEDAYNRASIIARGSKGSIGRMTSSSMGVFQIVGLNSEDEYSWGGTFNTSSKLKTASVTVRSSFEVD
ncbi:SIMPL domain-containing protein [Porphyromonas sp. COT-239 OH1446]|uniref:SIMPL domain-containing protein n=1 Tax=Porphyromonas sp. COT-239 OH1446 TaxID=1515613 RepID=UPI00052E1709|nr:SIMPL domain-containing protein [Porphyromonas sp. COT-239 OH1446]KGN71713.1 hypothetical protein HQ37_01395 [Porphyromonas sp. COT-239 OH1446]